MPSLMQMLKDYLSLRFFRRNRVSGVIAQTQTQDSPQLPEWSIYQTAEECPAKLYSRCQVEKNWRLLVKSGNPPQSVIEDAGLSIHSEFSQIAGGIQIADLIKRAKAINTLASKIDRVQTLLLSAQSICYAPLCEELAAEGYKIDPDADDTNYLEQVSKANSRLKGERLRLEQMLSEKPKAKDGKDETTMQGFYQTIRIISKEQGYAVKADEITVLEYALSIRDLRDKASAIEAEARKTKTNTKARNNGK